MAGLQFAAHFSLDLAALLLVPALFLLLLGLQDLLLDLAGGVVAGLAAGAEVVGFLVLAHQLGDAGLVLLSQRQGLLGLGDGLLAGQQAVKHATHFRADLDIQPGQILVHADQPALKARECVL